MVGLLRISEVARNEGVTEKTVRKWRSKGLRGIVLPVIPRGGRIFIDPAVLERWFKDVAAARSLPSQVADEVRRAPKAASAARKHNRERHGIGQ
jgi:hypothetical protein